MRAGLFAVAEKSAGENSFRYRGGVARGRRGARSAASAAYIQSEQTVSLRVKGSARGRHLCSNNAAKISSPVGAASGLAHVFNFNWAFLVVRVLQVFRSSGAF